MAAVAVTALHALDAEQGVLGAALLSAESVPHAGDLAGRHFYDPVHGDLWEEIVARYRAGRLADAVALKPWFTQRSPELGAVYLMRLMECAAPLRAQVAGYADMIRAVARRRALAALATETATAALASDADADTIQAALERRLAELAAADAEDAFERIGEAAAHAVERAELGEAAGISTGFTKLDEMIGGLRPALYLLGAASSMGKSTLLAAISRNVAAQGYGVAEFSLEMDSGEHGLRTAAALAFQNDHRVHSPHYLTAQRGALQPAQWQAMRGAARAAAHLPIWTDYRPGRTVGQIEASARRLFARMRREGVAPGLAVIDHEGLIAPEPGARFPSQLERTNARAEALMALPKRLGVPVLVAGQLTKEGKRADGEDRLPSGDDWKYGGALIEAARVVILVHRRAFYAERKPEHLRSPDDWEALRSRETTLVVDKCRGGRRGQMTIWMDMPTAAVWEDAA